MAWVLSSHENERQDKRVESILVPCLDAGSNPAISTEKGRMTSSAGPFSYGYDALCVVAEVGGTEGIVVRVKYFAYLCRRIGERAFVRPEP